MVDNHEVIRIAFISKFVIKTTYILGLMITILAGLLAVTNVSNRNWEQWDHGHVAEVIDSYWLGSQNEIAHREVLAALVKRWMMPGERLLEIGCGSGLVYNQLVPHMLPNHAYVGIDISAAMLKIACKRFPEGNFFKDDLYALSFPNNSFEIATAFEVFGHINGIEKPIAEMFRVASRLAIFTIWRGPKTKVEQECIESSVFIRTTFSEEDVLKAIDNALNCQSYTVYIQPLSNDKTAFIIQKQ